MHAADLGFNELDTKRTDAARATRISEGQGNGAEAKVRFKSEEDIFSVWVWKPNLGWHRDSAAGLQLRPPHVAFMWNPWAQP